MKSRWNRVKLSDYVGLKHGYQFRDEDFTEEGVPIIKIGNVWEKGLNLDNISYISLSRFGYFENYRIKNGDILMSLTSTDAFV